MNEEVIINVSSPGAEITAAEFKKLAEGADKASVSVDKLTGAVSGSITVHDKETGTVKKLVVEKGKLKSATESYTRDLAKEEAATRAAAAAQERIVAATARATAESNKAAAAIRAQSTATSELTNLVVGLGSAFTALQVGQAVANILRLNDSMQQTSNTLRAYSTSVGEFNAASSQLSSIATSQGASLASLTTAYGNLRTSTTFAHTEATTLTGVLASANAAIRLTAPNAQAAAQGLGSFTEQLAKGRITGDEFAKIMREFPALANALAKGSGIGAESLKVLGISSGMATDALLKQKGALEEATKSNDSLVQSFEILREKFAEYISKSDEVGTASKALSEILKFVANNLDLIITALGAAIAVWGTYRLAVIAATAVSVIFNTTVGGGVIGILVRLAATLATVTAAWYGYKAAVDSANSGSKNVSPPTPNSPPAQAIRDQQRKDSYTRQSQAPRREDVSSYSNDSGSFQDISGARAKGGPVSVGKRYLVGEEGPELFMPGRAGTIIPNGQSRAMAGGDGAGAGAGMSTQAAIDLMARAVTAGTKDAFAALQTSLDKLVDLVQSASTGNGLGVGGGSSTGTGAMDALIPGVSAINNFGQPTIEQPAPTMPANNNAPSFPSMGGGGGGGSNDNTIRNTDNGTILMFARKYAELVGKNDNGFLTDRQRRDNYLNAERYIANVPDGIRDTVKALSGTFLPTKMTGGQSVGSFRSGGSFMVPGSTGADSKHVGMRVSPGERVDILTRKQQQERENSGNGDTIVNIELNVQTPDSNSFRNSEKQLGRQLVQELNRAVR